MHISQAVTKTDDSVAINVIINDFLHRNIEKSASMGPYYQQLWSEIARLMTSGGKRLRPRLTILTYRLFGGPDVTAILPAAAAQELLHLGMLIHDDVIDRDYIRYGVDNVAGAYRKHYDELVTDPKERLHYSDSAALLAGDLMISEAYLLMTEARIDPLEIIAVQRLLAQGIFEVVGGELLDTEASFRQPGTVAAELTALYKTASYTFTLPMLVGAHLAGASQEAMTQVKVFSRNIGIAYQLQDDIIGIFGDSQQTGKSTLGDLREGKHTYMIEQFYSIATKEQRQTFEHSFGDKELTDKQADELRMVLVESGALEHTRQAVALYEQKARAAIDTVTFDHAYLGQLNELIDVATRRVK